MSFIFPILTLHLARNNRRLTLRKLRQRFGAPRDNADSEEADDEGTSVDPPAAAPVGYCDAQDCDGSGPMKLKKVQQKPSKDPKNKPKNRLPRDTSALAKDMFPLSTQVEELGESDGMDLGLVTVTREVTCSAVDDPTLYISDTGSTRTLTSNRADLSNARPANFEINCANGDAMRATLMGNIGPAPRAAFVPDSDYKLLGVADMCDKGYDFLYQATGLRILDSATGELMGFGERIGNLWYVNPHKIKSKDTAALASTKPNKRSPDTWHSRTHQ